MEKVKIVDTLWLDKDDFNVREETDMIVIHHTGNPRDDDLSAAEIHCSHLAQGWAGIGYHYVVRKGGTVEKGRPDGTIGAHAEGDNWHTIGIHLSGNFEIGEPTDAQIESCAHLVANLCEDYGIPIDREHIVGHRELDSTACPGRNLFAKMDLIVGKANWYANQEASESDTGGKEDAWREDLKSIQKELSNEKRIWDFLKEKGLSDFAVAGIMGNLYAESGLSPVNLENYYESKLGMTDEEYTAAVDNGSYKNFVNDSAGYGLAQWTYWSRKQGLLELAKSKGASIGNLDVQLEYLWQEMQGYHGMMAKLQNAASVMEASNAVLLDFERPADQSEAVQKRRSSFGQEFYDKYAGRETASGEKEETEMRYNTIAEMPEWARPAIEKLIAKGSLKGGGKKDADGNPADLGLTETELRIYTVLDREKVFD